MRIYLLDQINNAVVLWFLRSRQDYGSNSTGEHPYNLARAVNAQILQSMEVGDD